MDRGVRGRWSVTAVTLLAALTVLAVACGGGDDPAPATSAAPTASETQAAAATTDEDVEVGVALTEWGIELDDQQAHAAGDVTFAVRNDGGVPHELVVIRTDLAPDALPTAAGLVDEAAVEVIGRTGQIGGGAAEAVTFALSSGNYVLVCNIPAHYDLGMRVAFTVQ